MSDNLMIHVLKCRFCFKWMKEKVKITPQTKQMFFDLTNLWLRSGENYSKYVCDVCDRKLQRFSSYQISMISRQEMLNEHEDQKESSSNRLVGILGIDDIKIEVESLFEEIECSDQEENGEPLAVVETSFGTPSVTVTEVDESKDESNIPVEDVTQSDEEDRQKGERIEESNQTKQKAARSRQRSCPKCSANVKIKSYQAHMDQHKLDQHKLDQHKHEKQEALEESDDMMKSDYHFCNCGQMFESRSALKAHQKLCHTKPPKPTTTCTVCKKSFKSRLLLVNHIHKVHKTEVIHEVRRVKRVPEIAHQQSHTLQMPFPKKKKFKCLSCLERFSWSEDLSLHSTTCGVLKKAKLKTLNICLVPDCDFSTYEKITMNKHLTAHTDIDLRLKNDMLKKLERL